MIKVGIHVLAVIGELAYTLLHLSNIVFFLAYYRH